MDKLVLTLPGFRDGEQLPVPQPSGLRAPFNANDFSLGTLISEIMPFLFYIAAFLAFFMLINASLRWIFSNGNKETIAKARARITWAIIGLAVTILAFFISNFVKEVLAPKNIPITPLSKPPKISFVSTVHAAGPTDLSSQYGFGYFNTPGELISQVIPTIFGILGFALLIYTVWVGVKYMTSGGNKEEIAKARAMIMQAIIGIIVLMFSFLIIQFLLKALFGIDTIKVIKIG